MRGEFEKQVQERLDELKLNPTPPVWQNIKKEISDKRDRRRVVLWIPLFVLITAATWWLLLDNEKDPAGVPQSLAPAQHNQPASAQKRTADDGSDQSQDFKATNSNPTEKKNSSADVVVTKQRLNFPRAATAQRQQTIPGKTGGAVDQSNLILDQQSGATPSTQQNSGDDIISKTAETQKEEAKPIEPVERKTDASVSDSIAITDSVVQPVVKSPAKKWRIGVVGGVGTSGMVKAFANLDKAAPAYQNSPPGTGSGGNALIMPPSDETSGTSLLAGMTIKRQLSKKVDFVTGIQYQLYSTRVATGQLVRRDTVFNNNNSFTRVDQFFQSAASSQMVNRSNRYHFLSIPATFRFSMTNTSPLFLQTGVLMQQLVSTNALVYDRNTGFYYSDKSMFRKTQVSWLGGVGASVSKHVNIAADLQYSLRSILQNNRDKHLFSAGIKAEIFLK